MTARISPAASRYFSPLSYAACAFVQNPGSVRPIPEYFDMAGTTESERLGVKGAKLFTGSGPVHMIPKPLLEHANAVRCGEKKIGDPLSFNPKGMMLCFFDKAVAGQLEQCTDVQRFNMYVDSPEIMSWVLNHFKDAFEHPFVQSVDTAERRQWATSGSSITDWRRRLKRDDDTGVMQLYLDEFEMHDLPPEGRTGYVPSLAETGDIKIDFKWSNSERQGIPDYGMFYLVNTREGLQKILKRQVRDTPGMAFMFFEIEGRLVLAISDYEDPGGWRSTSHHTIRRGMRLVLNRLEKNPDQATLHDAGVRGYLKKIFVSTAGGDSERIAVTNISDDNFERTKEYFIRHLGIYVAYKPVELTSRYEQKFQSFGWR